MSYLRERQWSVIPLSPRTKRAMVKWKQFARRLPTEREVRAWWTKYPDANVGIVTGAVSNLVVIDIDPEKGGDAFAWRKEYPTELSSVTGRGGAHFFYSYPAGATVVHNSANRLAQGVDVRGDGGYVAAPPSIHENGKPYVWMDRGEPSDVPLELFMRSSENGNSNGAEPRVDSEHWLQRILQGVKHGERNDASARLAGYLLGKKIPRDVIVQQMLAWNALNDPPLSKSRIEQTVDSVAQTAADNAARRPTFELEQSESDEPVGAYDTIRLDAYLAKYGSVPLTWIVKDWLPEQTVGMVVAPPGSYKTWLLQDLAISVATGMPFLGRFAVEKRGPVLFMQQEDWHGQIAHRFSLIASRRAGMSLPRMKGDEMFVHFPPDIPIHLHEQRRFKFDDEEVVNAWIEKIRAIRPSLVILDPLYSAGSVEDFMAGTAAAMFLFKSIRDSLGTAFLIAHHTRKTARVQPGMRSQVAESAPEREDVWGSQFLNAWMETGWQIRRREEAGTATIARHFKVQSDSLRAVLGFKIDTTQTPGKYEVHVQDTKPGEKEKGVDLVALIEEQGPSTASQLASASGMHRASIFRRMQNLQKAGMVVCIKNKYHLQDSLEVQNG